MDRTALHKSTLDLIHGTYVRKNNDYGDSFTRTFKKYGIVAAMVRMEDKWNRLEALTTGTKQMVSDESTADTLLDLANYAIMSYMELQIAKNKEDCKVFEGNLNDNTCLFGKIETDSCTADLASAVTSVKSDVAWDAEVVIPDKVSTKKKEIDVGKVMALRKAKWSQKKIADEMGCSQALISQIIKAN